jgi:hypothetical protein
MNRSRKSDAVGAQIYRKTGTSALCNFSSAIQSWRAPSDISGFEVDDALNIAEQIEL